MLTPFGTADFNNQLNRTLSRIAWRAACLGECLATAELIEDGNTDSWHDAWRALADRLAGQAKACLEAGRLHSSADCFRRAAEYYRQATFFHRVNLDDERLQSAWRLSRQCTLAAIEATGGIASSFRVPFEGSGLDACFFCSPAADEPAPTIIAPSGYDGILDETYCMIAAPALARGYHVLAFDGPGQGATLYDPDLRLFMRPDWESVLPAVVDHAVGLPGVDAGRLVAMGISFGGYLVPRGVSGEPRIAALVADPGQFDIGSAVLSKLPSPLKAAMAADEPTAVAAFQRLLEKPEGRLLFEPRMAAHGLDTVLAYVRDLQRYTMAGAAERITCPALICDNEEDPVSTGQGARLAEAIGPQAQSVRFTIDSGAGGHCEGIGREIFEQVAFDWLDRLFQTGQAPAS